MKTENAVRTAIQFFLIMLIGSLVFALVGGLFGMLVAIISPDFVGNLFSPSENSSVTRYAFAVGMIWGVFIGAAVSGFACLLAAVIKILKIRLEYKRGKEASRPSSAIE